MKHSFSFIHKKNPEKNSDRTDLHNENLEKSAFQDETQENSEIRGKNQACPALRNESEESSSLLNESEENKTPQGKEEKDPTHIQKFAKKIQVWLHHFFLQHVLPILLIALSLLLFLRPWIISPVVAAYGGVFQDATELTGSISKLIYENTGVNLSIADRALDDISDGAFGPKDIFTTSGDLRKTLVRLTGNKKALDLSELVDDKDLSRILRALLAFQILIASVVILAMLQIALYFIKGEKTKIPVYFIGNAALSAVFIAAEIILFRDFPVLKFHLTAWLFISLALALPYRFWLWAGRKVRLLYIILKNRNRKVPKEIYWRRRRRVASVLLTIAVIAGLEYYFAYVYPKYHEPVADDDSTSTDPLYSDEEIKNILRKYGFTDEVMLKHILRNSYVIPGLKTTETLAENTTPDICTSMTPQGVTPAGDYLLISAYCASGEHNSVVYVLNKAYHTYVKTIVLPNRPHVGGITYDPVHQNIWICDYMEKTRTAYVSAFSMDQLVNYSLNDKEEPIAFRYSMPIYSMKRTSFLDYHDGKLYIGNFKAGADSVSTVQTFAIDEVTGDIRSDSNDVSKLLKLNKKVIVPSGITLINGGIQGFTVNNKVTALSQSFGPVDSRLMEFKNYGTLMDYVRLSSVPDRSYTLPPMLEQITADQGKLYLCFESAAYPYRSRWNDKIDRILVLDL